MSLSQQRSRVGNAAKTHKAQATDDTRRSLDEARRALAEEKIRAFVEQTVASAPPLTPEQRDRLALLLRGGTG